VIQIRPYQRLIPGLLLVGCLAASSCIYLQTATPAPAAPAATGPAATNATGPAWPDDKVVDRYHQIWYDNPGTWLKNSWMGIPTEQNPNDIWIMQEILFDLKPDFVVECGSYRGGSAAVWAMLLREVNPAGRVISIDIVDNMQEARKLPVVKERVAFLVGSSTSPEIVAEVTRRVQGKNVLILLDSDHHKPHVLNEIRAYSPLIPVGGYLIVQDTNVNGHPIYPDFGPGPAEAVQEFLAGNDKFVQDRSKERLLFTFAPGGFLKRVKP
jgi:cephalosporin hydroxylase